MKIIDKIRQKSEAEKRGIALGLSITITLLVAVGWAGERGLLGGGRGSVAESQNIDKSSQTAAVVKSVSPVESSKRTLFQGLEGIQKSYQDFKESVSSVLVPFITGIEVYERK